jgi:uncharacterized protein (DUF2164 family)
VAAAVGRTEYRSFMTIKLSDETEQRVITSIKQYASENMEEEIGDLKARLLMDFFLKELGPSIYNKAIADAQAHMHDRVGDLDGSCFEPEFSYWKR